jgi:hypothetical protein
MVDHWRLVTIRIICRTLLKKLICSLEVVDDENIDSECTKEDEIPWVTLKKVISVPHVAGSLTIFLRHSKVGDALVLSRKIKKVAHKRQGSRSRREWQATRVVSATNVELAKQIA